MNAEQRLSELGLTLPPAPAPVASYVPCVLAGDLLFTSGQVPVRDGRVLVTGKLGGNVSIEQGQEAARLAALNALAQVATAIGSLNNVRRIVRVGVFVNSAPGFTRQPLVANGASDLLIAIFGEAGWHARTAVGVNELPLDAAVEVELIAQVSG